jgi:hypothetical protein
MFQKAMDDSPALLQTLCGDNSLLIDIFPDFLMKQGRASSKIETMFYSNILDDSSAQFAEFLEYISQLEHCGIFIHCRGHYTTILKESDAYIYVDSLPVRGQTSLRLECSDLNALRVALKHHILRELWKPNQVFKSFDLYSHQTDSRIFAAYIFKGE